MAVNSNDSSPDIKKLTFTWLNKKLGKKWSAITIIVLCALGFAWWNWSHISNLPGIAHVLDRLARDSLPIADPKRFSTAVAHLYGDDAGYPNEILLIETLKELGVTQVLQFDRTIYVRSSKPEEAERAGHVQAREYLKQSGADVLIWGTVFSTSGQTSYKLYWATNAEAAARWGRYQPTGNLSLPQLLWSDVTNILLCLVEPYQLQYQQGIDFVSDLRSYVNKLEALLDRKGQIWGRALTLKLQILLASSLSMLAQETHGVSILIEAVRVYREISKEFPRDQDPVMWALIQHNLGASLMEMGLRKGEPKYFRESIKSFDKAIEVRSRQQFPFDWARTQSVTGVTLRLLGEHERNTENLDAAIERLRNALQVQTVERVPTDWALTHFRLAGALLMRGLRESDTTRLIEAEQAQRQAFRVWTMENAPRFWSQAQMNLADILLAVGERGGGTEKLEEALDAYAAFQKFHTRERDPIAWAGAQHKIGITLQVLGERDNSVRGTTRLKEAIRKLHEALAIRTQSGTPVAWAETQMRIGVALTVLGMREEGTRKLEEATKAFQSALKVITRKQFPGLWASLQYNLALNRLRLGEKTRNSNHFCEAFQNAREAWYTFSEVDNSTETARAQTLVVGVIQRYEKLFSKKTFSNCLTRLPL